jgi:hypothetical protein
MAANTGVEYVRRLALSEEWEKALVYEYSRMSPSLKSRD